MLCDNNRDDFGVIIKKFLSCVSLKSISIDETLFEGWNAQELLLNETVNNPLVVKYPLKIGYQSQFLKKFIDLFERKGIEVHDDIYLSYCKLLKEKTDVECYKHYKIDDRTVITLRESASFISEGTTGLCSWQASLALSEWCILNEDILKGRNVLELGCGVGLVGITIARICQPQTITLTDCHESVLKTLCHNVDINLSKSSDKTSDIENSDNRDNRVNICADNCEHSRDFCELSVDSRNLNAKLEDKSGHFCENSISRIKTDCKPKDNLLLSLVYDSVCVNVLDLNWEEVGVKYSGGSPDVILGADIVYDSEIFEPLSEALLYYFGVNNKSIAIFACTERNEQTLEGFLSILVSKRLVVKEIRSAPQKYFYWNNDTPIRFFKISSA